MNEYRPGGFSILPPVVKNLIIINVLFFLTTLVLQKSIHLDLNQYLDLYYPSSPLFKVWQPITYMFMHAGWGHLLFNMFALWMFGYVIENLLGPKKFLVFYFICGLGAAACHLTVTAIESHEALTVLANADPAQINQSLEQYFSGEAISGVFKPWVVPTLGASGAVFGVLFAFGYLFPNVPIYLYFLFPIKAKWFVGGYIALELFYGVSGTQEGVAHFAHLGGVLFAYLLLRYWNLNHKNTFL